MSIATIRRIVFVCVENSCRSQIAEAFARLYAGPNVEVYSAGSRPSGQVNPKAIAAMKEIGYDLTTHASKSLDDLPRVEFDAAITMGCGDECPLLGAKQRADWGIPDPKYLTAEEFRQVRDVIADRVRELLARL
jgi:arsenate reductase